VTNRGILVRPHSPFVGPALIATLHVLATLDDPKTLCERIYCTLEASVAGKAIDVIDGAINVPDAPGMGITIDEDVVARYRVR
jgi:D-galactarolactone cycloisomerase